MMDPITMSMIADHIARTTGDSGGETGHTYSTTRRARRSFLRGLGKLLELVGVVFLVTFVGGFFVYIATH